MAEHIALRVLRERRAEVRTDAPVDARRIGLRVALDAQAADQREADAVLELVQDFAQLSRQAGQFEVRLRELRDLDLPRLHRGERAIDLGDVAGVEVQGPVGVALHVLAFPGAGVHKGGGCKCGEGHGGHVEK